MNPFVEEIVDKTAAATELDAETARTLLAVPPDDKMGDYALPCFSLAKQLRKSPVDIATDLASRIEPLVGEGSRIAHVEAAGPYVNFRLDRSGFITHTLQQIAAEGQSYGSANQGQGKQMVIDYSAPNLAKPFHIAHLRSTAIGNAIYRIHAFLGWDCTGINHLGDYGANFGQLLAAYGLWGDREKIRANPVPELLELYVQFNEAVETQPELVDQARECLRKLAAGDEEMVSLWQYFISEGRKEAERIYRILDVQFDVTLGESFYADMLDDVITLFDESGLAVESDGALIVSLEEFDMAPCILRTGRGTSTYHSRDIAALLYRFEQYEFDKIVYVTDVTQSLHFRQLFKAIELSGKTWIDRCTHASFGLMTFKGEKISTRRGNTIFLEEVLDQAIELTADIIAEKNPQLANKEDVARKVGISAVIFADVSHRRNRDIVFDLRDVLNFDGETGPYIQYTHARFCSILRKHGAVPDFATDLTMLGAVPEMRVARALANFPTVVDQACSENEPSYVASFLLELATVANKLYNELPVIVHDDDGLTRARICIVDGVRRVLATGLELLGMTAPEEM